MKKIIFTSLILLSSLLSDCLEQHTILINGKQVEISKIELRNYVEKNISNSKKINNIKSYVFPGNKIVINYYIENELVLQELKPEIFLKSDKQQIRDFKMDMVVCGSSEKLKIEK